MYTIVGLGNPGKRYKDSRHNVGWIVLEAFLSTHGLPSPVDSSKYSGRVAEGVLEGEEVTALFPTTYMNKSGSSVKKLVRSTEAAAQCIVMYDDVDLALGEVKVSYGKGSGGHKGMQSVIDALGTKDFIRVRIGIAPKSFWTGKVRRPSAGAPMTRHVLGIFKKSELKTLETVYERVDEILTVILTDGVEAAMNKYN